LKRFVSSSKPIGIWPGLYCLWALLAICLAVALAGLSSESITRLLTIAFLFVQIALRSTFVKAFSWLSPRTRFIALGTVLAMVVEGFHMISRPVFLSLRIGWNTSLVQGLFQLLNYQKVDNNLKFF
jgi:hypothetical protein